MGRNKNKANRSSHRGTPASSSSKKDSGLPAFFRHRHFAKLPNKANDEAHEGAMDMDEPAEGLGEIDTATRHASLGSLDASLITLGQAASTAHDGVQHPSSSTTSASAKAALDAFERKVLDPTLSGKRDNSMRAFMKEMRKVLELADVLLEVLDARDPMACRSLATERLALSQGKRIILILNKIDLVPRANVEAWLKYLRNDFPTLAFKSSTQQQRSNLSQGRGDVPGAHASSSTSSSSKANGSASTSVMGGGSEALGANALLQLLKNYSRSSRSSSFKTSLHVGVFGTPNVGKSSLINSLKRARVCGVASTPGHTKVVQTVALDRGIRLLDCPGIVFLDGDNRKRNEEEEAWQALRNTVKVELIDDPIKPVQAIINRVPASQLTALYNITGGFDEGDVQDFLLRLALLKGKLGRGGIADLDGTARIVLHDWNTGRINYWTEPPKFHKSAGAREAEDGKEGAKQGAQGDEASIEEDGDAQVTAPTIAPTEVAGATLVSQFSEAFDLAALLGEADAEALGAGDGVVNPDKPTLVRSPPATAATVQVSSNANGDIKVDDEGASQDQTSAGATLRKGKMKKPRSSLGKRRRGMDDDESSDDSSDEEGDDDARLPIARDDEDEDDLAASLAPQGATATDEPAWLQRQRAKAASSTTSTRQPSTHAPLPAGSARRAELSRMFGEEELSGMALGRGGGRKKARKEKRRKDKEGQLVFELEMGLDIEDGVAGEENGMEDDVEEMNGSKASPGNPFAALGGATQDDDENLEDGEHNKVIHKQQLPESIRKASTQLVEEEEEEEEL